MAWRRLEDTFHDHPKFIRAARRLGVPPEYAEAYIHGTAAKLWSWALRHAPDGELTDKHVEDIEIAVGWHGEPGAWVEAMVHVNLLDRRDDKLFIHDDDEHGGSKERAERRKRERQKKNVVRQSRDTAATSSDRAALSLNVALESKEESKSESRSENKTESSQRGEIDMSSSASEPDGSRPESTQASNEILAVFAHYRTHHPRAHRKPHSKMKEWRAVKARLTEGYTVEDLCRAIDGCHESPFHQGTNDTGAKYDGLELIVRDSSKVQKFMEIHERRQSGTDMAGLDEKTRRGAYAAQEWLRERQRKNADAG